MLLPLIITIKHRRDINARRRVKQLELATYVNRALQRNKEFGKQQKRYFKFPPMRTSRVKNICLWNGRCRGINYKGFSRHAVKFLGTRGRWLGLKKASW